MENKNVGWKTVGREIKIDIYVSQHPTIDQLSIVTKIRPFFTC